MRSILNFVSVALLVFVFVALVALRSAEKEPLEPLIETTCTDFSTGHTTVNHLRGTYYGQANAMCSHKVVEGGK